MRALPPVGVSAGGSPARVSACPVPESWKQPVWDLVSHLQHGICCISGLSAPSRAFPVCVSLVSNRYGVQRAEQMPGPSFRVSYTPEIGHHSRFFLGLNPHEGLSVLLKYGCECPLLGCQAYSAFLLGAF